MVGSMIMMNITHGFIIELSSRIRKQPLNTDYTQLNN